MTRHKKVDRILSPAFTIAALAAISLFFACSAPPGSDETSLPANINPIKPIRDAFITRILSLDAPIQGYKAETGHVPEGDSTSVFQDAGITPVPSMDPWGGSVQYSGSGSDYEFRSAGPDKRWATKDDITIRNGALQSPL